MHTIQPLTRSCNGVLPIDRPKLITLMHARGAGWAADCIVRRHRIHPRHAALVVGMLGVAECRR